MGLFDDVFEREDEHRRRATHFVGDEFQFLKPSQKQVEQVAKLRAASHKPRGLRARQNVAESRRKKLRVTLAKVDGVES